MTDVHCQREGDARRKVGNLKRLGSALCGVYGVLVYTTRGGSARYDSARDVSTRDVSARDVSARDVSARDISARDGRFRETPATRERAGHAQCLSPVSTSVDVRPK